MRFMSSSPGVKYLPSSCPSESFRKHRWSCTNDNNQGDHNVMICTTPWPKAQSSDSIRVVPHVRVGHLVIGTRTENLTNRFMSSFVLDNFRYQWYKQTIFLNSDLKKILPTRLASSFENLYLGIMEAAAAEVEAEAAADGVTAEEHGKGKWNLNFSYYLCVLKELSFVKCWYIVLIQCLFCLENPTPNKKTVQSRPELRILQGWLSRMQVLWESFVEKKIDYSRTWTHGPNTTNIIMR